MRPTEEVAAAGSPWEEGPVEHLRSSSAVGKGSNRGMPQTGHPGKHLRFGNCRSCARSSGGRPLSVVGTGGRETAPAP